MQLVLDLKEEERIFIEANAEVCRRINYLIFQKTAYQNLFLSYINKTSEEADRFHLEDFLQQLTQVYLDEYEETKNEAIRLLGPELYLLIMEPRNNRHYYIDTERRQLIISLRGKQRVNLHSCDCATHSKV